MKKHDFLPKNYRLQTKRKLSKWFKFISGILVFLNLIVFYSLYKINGRYNSISSAVFNSNTVQRKKTDKEKVICADLQTFNLYEAVLGSCDGAITIDSLKCDENKAEIQVEAENVETCMEALKKMSLDKSIQVEDIEPIAAEGKYYVFKLIIKRC